jgi:cell division protein FtsB
MPLGTVIALGALVISGLALGLSRRDVQSQKTKTALADLNKRVEFLEDENERLRNENLRLMHALFNCPTEDCPMLRPNGRGGIERREKQE